MKAMNTYIQIMNLVGIAFLSLSWQQYCCKEYMPKRKDAKKSISKLCAITMVIIILMEPFEGYLSLTF